MLVKLVLVATLTVMASRVVNTFTHTHRRRLHARPAALPAPLQTWESEGGGLPGGPSTATRSDTRPSTGGSTSAAEEAEASLGHS
jgi:hypothetical protein